MNKLKVKNKEFNIEAMRAVVDNIIKDHFIELTAKFHEGMTEPMLTTTLVTDDEKLASGLNIGSLCRLFMAANTLEAAFKTVLEETDVEPEEFVLEVLASINHHVLSEVQEVSDETEED